MYQNQYSIIPTIKSCDSLHEIQNIKNVFNQSLPFMSQRFPVYPLQIIICSLGKPFNKLEISAHSVFCPSKIKIYFSENAQEYRQIGQLNFICKQTQKFKIRILTFKQKVIPQFVKLKLFESIQNKQNICKQIGIYGVKLYDVILKNCKYLYNLQMDHKYPAKIIKLLRVVEHLKMEFANQNNYEICDHYQKLINQINQKYQQLLKYQNLKNSQKINQIINYCNVLLQKYQIKQSPIKNISPDIKKKASVKPSIIKQKILQINPQVLTMLGQKLPTSELVLLSSNDQADQQKFILDIWEKLKVKQRLNKGDEELLINIFLYFLSSNKSNQNLKLIFQVFELFCKKIQSMDQNISLKYQKILILLLNFLDNQQLPAIQIIYRLYSLFNPHTFIDIIINSNQKIEILRPNLLILYNLLCNFNIENYFSMIINYIKSIFKNKNPTKQIFQLCINILSQIAKKISIAKVIDNFNDVPVHTLLNIEKNLKNKVKQKKQNNLNQQKIQDQLSDICKFCKKQNQNFLDEDLYDMHCYRDCIYLTKCNYCQTIHQIPQLEQHYLKQCPESIKFKKCQDCGYVYHVNIEPDHQRNCQKMKGTWCVLCKSRLQDKSQLQNHIRMKICLKNERVK